MNTNAINPVEDYKAEALFGRSRLNVNMVIACRIDDDFPQNYEVFIANKLYCDNLAYSLCSFV